MDNKKFMDNNNDNDGVVFTNIPNYVLHDGLSGKSVSFCYFVLLAGKLFVDLMSFAMISSGVTVYRYILLL